MTEIIPEKRIRFSLFGVIFVALSLISLILFIDYRFNKETPEEQQQGESIDEEQINEETNGAQDTEVDVGDDPDTVVLIEEPELKKLNELTYSGWIPIWDFSNAIDNILLEGYPMTSVSPVWYGVQQDGSLLDRRNYAASQISSLPDSIDVIPTISTFDPDIMQGIFQDEVKFNRHISSIIAMVEANGYSGIDIDYEVIYQEDKPDFMRLLEELSRRLHAQDKILSVTVLSQWGATSYSSFPETRAVQDYVEISKYADEIRIMCYDYTSLSSGKPGPIGPIDWIDSVLSYATSIINSEKIVLGIHLYGYRWNQDGGVTATTYDQMNEIESSDNYEYLFNYSYDEGVSEYSIEENSYTHFFQTEEGVVSRAELAAKYDLKGLIFWRLGRESSILDSLFDEVKQ